MKFLVLFFFICTYALAFGQFASRAGFAGTMPKGEIYGDVHPNFRSTETPNVLNRNAGFEDSGPSSTSTPRTVNPEEVYQSWPRENRPFGVLNRAQVEQHLYPDKQQNAGTPQQNLGDNSVQSRNNFQVDNSYIGRQPSYDNIKQLKSSRREGSY